MDSFGKYTKTRESKECNSFLFYLQDDIRKAIHMMSTTQGQQASINNTESFFKDYANLTINDEPVEEE